MTPDQARTLLLCKLGAMDAERQLLVQALEALHRDEPGALDYAVELLRDADD